MEATNIKMIDKWELVTLWLITRNRDFHRHETENLFHDMIASPTVCVWGGGGYVET